MEDVIKEEQIREHANEVDDGAYDTWKHENHDSLVSEFIGDYDELFRNYCKDRFKEVYE